MADDRPTITVNAAAAELGVHPHTVRRWIAAGTLPAFYIGGRVRIRRSDIEQVTRPVHTGSAS